MSYKMWMVKPKFMCDVHIIKEHDNIHWLVSQLEAGEDLIDLAKKGEIELRNINARHDSLVIDMQERGIEHNSNIPYCHVSDEESGTVDLIESTHDLMASCSDCCKRFEKNKHLIEGLNLYAALEAYTRAHTTMKKE